MRERAVPLSGFNLAWRANQSARERARVLQGLPLVDLLRSGRDCPTPFGQPATLGQQAERRRS